MTDLYIEPVEDKPRWYQRRGPQVAVAGGVTAVLAFTGFGINAASGTESNPQEAVAEAAANLKELPASVTITGGEQNPGSVTLTQTDAGVQVSVSSDELGGTLELALIGETLFIRVDADQLSQVTANPMLAMAIAQFPSIGALLQGEWVSLDVSEDSEVLTALRDAQEAEVGTDPDSLQAAAEELRTSLTAVGDDVQPSLVAALKDNATVTAVADETGPEGSDHYRVSVDADQVKQTLTPVLRDAFDQVMQALDTFVAEVGAELPGGPGQWETNRGKLVEDFEKALAKPTGEDPVVDVWIADGEFTRISTAQTTLTFNSDPTLDAPETAVSLDEDLLNALPLLEQYGSGLMGEGLQGQLPGLAG